MYHWSFFCACSNIRGRGSEGRVNRLYQWLSGRASFFRTGTSSRGAGRTIRTEVTVERQGMTLVVGGAPSGFDACPLCGSKLAPNQAEQLNGRLLETSISHGPFPVDGASP
jgi:hypothetical protein